MRPESGHSTWWERAWPPLLAFGTVGAVGVPAAVASYRHARDVIAAHGDPVMAPWLPLSVDGMLVAALVVIWVRRHRGDRAGAFPWLAFGFGMVVTVLANLAAVAEPSPVAFAVALFPPLALAVTLELVALIAYRSAPRPTGPKPIVITHMNEVDPADLPDWWASAPEDDGEHDEGQDVEDAAGPECRTPDRPLFDGDQRVEELATLLDGGRSLTGAEVGARYGCSARTGRRLIAAAQDLSSARTAGSGASTDLVAFAAGGS